MMKCVNVWWGVCDIALSQVTVGFFVVLVQSRNERETKKVKLLRQLISFRLPEEYLKNWTCVILSLLDFSPKHLLLFSLFQVRP